MYNKDSVEIYQEIDFGKRTTAKYVFLSKTNCSTETRLNPGTHFTCICSTNDGKSEKVT